MTNGQKAQQILKNDNFWMSVFVDYIQMYLYEAANYQRTSRHQAEEKALNSVAYDMITDSVI